MNFIETSGWIKLHRKILDHCVFEDPNLLKTFIYCLLRANHKPIKLFFNHQEHSLNPGEFISGKDECSRDLKMKPIMFYRKLIDLEKLEILKRRTTNRFTLVSIINWDCYQGSQNGIETHNETRAKLRRNSDETQMKPDKNEKNEKNEKNKNIYGQFKNVLLTENEKEKVTDMEIENLSVGIASKGYKYKSHFATILSWRRKNDGRDPGNGSGTYRESKGKSTKYAGLETVVRTGVGEVKDGNTPK